MNVLFQVFKSESGKYSLVSGVQIRARKMNVLVQMFIAVYAYKSTVIFSCLVGMEDGSVECVYTHGGTKVLLNLF